MLKDNCFYTMGCVHNNNEFFYACNYFIVSVKEYPRVFLAPSCYRKHEVEFISVIAPPQHENLHKDNDNTDTHSPIRSHQHNHGFEKTLNREKWFPLSIASFSISNHLKTLSQIQAVYLVYIVKVFVACRWTQSVPSYLSPHS